MTNSKQDEIHIVCNVRAQAEHRDRVGELLLELVGPARGEAGCLYYDLYQERDLPSTFVLLDGWASEAALTAHGAHPNVARIVEQLTPLLAGPLEIMHSRRMSEST
jgi:quinol monooxygenase YgiN